MKLTEQKQTSTKLEMRLGWNGNLGTPQVRTGVGKKRKVSNINRDSNNLKTQ